jgi:hypothetical protein
MKTQARHFISRFGLAFLVLFAAIFWVAGCATRTPEVLAGFHFSSLKNLDSSKAITDDFQDYLQKLSPEERKYAGPHEYFEDGTGQHAIRIETDQYNERWYHVLIYDKENKRIKVIKYCEGRIQS